MDSFFWYSVVPTACSHMVQTIQIYPSLGRYWIVLWSDTVSLVIQNGSSSWLKLSLCNLLNVHTRTDPRTHWHTHVHTSTRQNAFFRDSIHIYTYICKTSPWSHMFPLKPGLQLQWNLFLVESQISRHDAPFGQGLSRQQLLRHSSLHVVPAFIKNSKTTAQSSFFN